MQDKPYNTHAQTERGELSVWIDEPSHFGPSGWEVVLYVDFVPTETHPATGKSDAVRIARGLVRDTDITHANYGSGHMAL